MVDSKHAHVFLLSAQRSYQYHNLELHGHVTRRALLAEAVGLVAPHVTARVAVCRTGAAAELERGLLARHGARHYARAAQNAVCATNVAVVIDIDRGRAAVADRNRSGSGTGASSVLRRRVVIGVPTLAVVAAVVAVVMALVFVSVVVVVVVGLSYDKTCDGYQHTGATCNAGNQAQFASARARVAALSVGRLRVIGGRFRRRGLGGCRRRGRGRRGNSGAHTAQLSTEVCNVEFDPPDEAEEDSDSYELKEWLAEALDESPAELSLLDEEDDLVAGFVVFLVVGFFVFDELSLLPESLEDDEVAVDFFFLVAVLLVDLDESLLEEDVFFLVELDVEVDLELSSDVPASSDPVLLSSSSSSDVVSAVQKNPTLPIVVVGVAVVLGPGTERVPHRITLPLTQASIAFLLSSVADLGR
ncbi:hypothetical protein GQ600_17 [Phytophthora cactorum]|nr:hypothetical protein GQ600_17 [Phytophthora cactorum]